VIESGAAATAHATARTKIKIKAPPKERRRETGETGETGDENTGSDRKAQERRRSRKPHVPMAIAYGHCQWKINLRLYFWRLLFSFYEF
jgi:hypothetical protein